MPIDKGKLADVVLLPPLGMLVLIACFLILHAAYVPEVGPLSGLSKPVAKAIRDMTSPDSRSRQRGALTIYGMAMTEPDDLNGAIPSLLAVLRTSNDDTVVQYLGQALVELGTQAVPDLVQAAQNRGETQTLRVRAIAILGAMGPQAAGALPALQNVDEDPNGEVRRAAARAVNRITHGL